ncbi:MAG: hypothetical protein Q9164_006334 [Protoblastenia rupestris]
MIQSAPRITSLKLRQIRLEIKNGHSCRLDIPTHLEHLDIEFSLDYISEDSIGRCTLIEGMSRWRSKLARLHQLRSLSLSLSYSSRYGSVIGPNDFHRLANKFQLTDSFFEKIFTNEDMTTEQSGIKLPSLPRLESLAFMNCPVNFSGLAEVLTAHNCTLKRLELCRVHLSISDQSILEQPVYPNLIVSVANVCKSRIPKLSNLRLTRLTLNGYGIIDQSWIHTHEWKKGDSPDALTVYHPSLPGFD